jgi:hypothetical protein
MLNVWVLKTRLDESLGMGESVQVACVNQLHGRLDLDAPLTWCHCANAQIRSHYGHQAVLMRAVRVNAFGKCHVEIELLGIAVGSSGSATQPEGPDGAVDAKR